MLCMYAYVCVFYNVGSEILVGLSTRTNMIGIESIRRSFPAYPVVTIDINNLNSNTHKPLHLKSFCSMCGDHSIITGGEEGKQLTKLLERDNKREKYDFLHVPDASAANCIFVNNHLLKRSDLEFPVSKPMFESLESNKIDICSDELSKVDGALTCCVLLVK